MGAAIIDRGRGPEIAGTRITVYDVLDYARAGWRPARIAVALGVSSEQVAAALAYIEGHGPEVEAVARAIQERIARGNDEAIRARQRASRARLKARLERQTPERTRGLEDAEPPGR